MTRRVVVTGVGMVTPLGNTAEESWQSAVAGRSGIGPLTRCAIDDLPPKVAVAGEVRGFSAEGVIERKEIKRIDPFIEYALVATDEALRNAGLQGVNHRIPDRDETGVIIGSGIGGLRSIMDTHALIAARGASRVSPFFIPASIINLASGHVAMRTGATGPNYATVSACATSNHAIGDAYHVILRGDADRMITGGTEACLTPISFIGYHAARALATEYDDPSTASRPFDLHRSGFVHAEGSTVLVLEELETARRRGAPILAEIVGFGMSADAHHITAPPEHGEGAQLSMRRALRNSGLVPEDVDYINAHGTSTPLGDIAETRAIRGVFGEHADRLAVSATKSMHGHALGATAAIEAGLCVMALRDQIIPPTINLTVPDPECDLDYVPNQARPADLDVILSNAFGFGGANTTLVLRRWSEDGRSA
jgi:3-oxoacyl-[acyl-carrier-protein] synthase II